MSEEERQDKLYELRELRKHWRQSENQDSAEHMKILQVRDTKSQVNCFIPACD
jgi:hypothetical protein